MADNIEQLYGDYGSNVLKQFAKTPREGLMPLADNVTFAAGCTGDHSTQCPVRRFRILIQCMECLFI